MNRTNTLPNGIVTVFAFEEIPEVDNPLIMFLAGTTSWNSDLVAESWRREFLKQIGQETCSGLIALDILIRDNNSQQLRCRYESKKSC